jgi:aspartate/methionine/tyrosine aminotransferase
MSQFLTHVPPMGIYETLYAFYSSYGIFMGEEGTHPWSQGFPLTTPIERFDGPSLPSSLEVSYEDRFYPKAWGHPKLRDSIADYYNSQYRSKITPENVMIFAGGRPGIFTVMAFLENYIKVRIGSIEWPAYLDILKRTNSDYDTIPFTKKNNFHPSNAEYFNRENLNHDSPIMSVLSNPQNPSGQTRSGEELRELIKIAEEPNNGILLDEAYEMFHSPSVSGIEFVNDIDSSNIFLSGACTKGLQSPGIRIGWIIASKSNIEIMSNYSSFGMGGVSHLSQNYAIKLLEPNRVKKAREAIEKHYNWQRERYGNAFKNMGLGVYTGKGGFYHWLELPKGLTSKQLNERLFKRGAAILSAFECDMARPHIKDTKYKSPYERFFRFSFGPLLPEAFETDIDLFRDVYEAYKNEMGIK